MIIVGGSAAMSGGGRLRMLRLAALGLSHETNTFATRLIDLPAVQAAGVLRGPQILFQHAGVATTMSGCLAAGAQPGIEVVPLVMTTLVPAGRLTAKALQLLSQDMVDALTAHGPFDGVLAALHGAAVAEDIADVDGYLLRQFREVVGPDVPIGASLDRHANIAAKCAKTLTCSIPTAPIPILTPKKSRRKSPTW